MPRALSLGLRVRVLAAVARGLSDRQAGERFGVILDQLADKSFLVLADDDVRYGPRFLADPMLAQEQQRNSCFSYYTHRIGPDLGARVRRI